MPSGPLVHDKFHSHMWDEVMLVDPVFGPAFQPAHWIPKKSISSSLGLWPLWRTHWTTPTLPAIPIPFSSCLKICWKPRLSSCHAISYHSWILTPNHTHDHRQSYATTNPLNGYFKSKATVRLLDVVTENANLLQLQVKNFVIGIPLPTDKIFNRMHNTEVSMCHRVKSLFSCSRVKVDKLNKSMGIHPPAGRECVLWD